MGLEEYRASEQERARTDDLLRVVPKGRRSVLDVGARDGHFSRLLTQHFAEVTALDLRRPDFNIPGVRNVQGDATNLEFPSGAFDCVFCAEVLEHISDVQQACREITRVARHEIIIGVPFQQDTRVGRTTCGACGKANPPWGHVNEFTEERLMSLFPGLQLVSKTFVGVNGEATNPLSTVLMDLGGNPWGTYSQEEPCIHCGAKLSPPGKRAVWRKGCSAMAARINRVQSRFSRTHANWIHVVFAKDR